MAHSTIKFEMKDISKQIPFATARALSALARDCRDEVKAQLPNIFDRPNPWTMRAPAAQNATKGFPVAAVFLQPSQLSYLQVQITGGTRLPKRRAIQTPVNIRLNAYGNIPRGAVTRAESRANTFYAVINGVSGVWQRNRRGELKLLVSYHPKAEYPDRFDFSGIVINKAKQKWETHFATAMAQALATARR